MDGYNVEELYYLYRQNNPIAKALLIKYCYWKAELMLPMYYFYSGIFYNEREDCIQEIVILVFRNLDVYRPDKGGLLKSYMSLIMHRAISTIIVNEKKKGLRKIKNTYFSLDGYCGDNNNIANIEVVRDSKCQYQPDVCIESKEQKELLEEFMIENFSVLEQFIAKERTLGYKNIEIAKMLKIDIKKIYNANYRIRKKMSKLKLFD